MYFLCSIIIIDCIVSYFTVEKEVNPLMAWMIPHIGLVGMLLVKILYSSMILFTVNKVRKIYMFEEDFEKWWYIGGIIYIIVWFIGFFGGLDFLCE